VLALELLAERKIAEAAERGELDDLPGAGQPLALDDAALIPEELRMAHRILKNSGFDSGFPIHRYSIAEKAKIESRYFGKVVRKLAK
jgi:hypothetical protein